MPSLFNLKSDQDILDFNWFCSIFLILLYEKFFCNYATCFHAQFEKNENKWHISYRLNRNSVYSALRDFPS